MPDPADRSVTAPTAEHFDVLVVGAGISGVAAGYHLQKSCPDRNYAILERRERLGGTWDLFRYPGIRSDSDMFTLGYPFRPWPNPRAIADGPAILEYVEDTAREFGIDRKIRFGHHVKRASWSSAGARWTVETERTDSGEPCRFTCSFLFMCSGYYDYDQGYRPDFPGEERFQGPIIHPQHWPEDFDYAGKRVVVIGSGATAVTLVPEMAKSAAHVTMLQRSPTYVVSMPAEDPMARVLQEKLSTRIAHSVIRWRNVLFGAFFFWFCRRHPALAKQGILKRVREQLGPGYDVKTHFTPRYNPWDQRMCLVPNGDLFEALKAGSAAVVTDHIDTFTETGIRLQSGQQLDADVIVTATGLNLKLCGGLEVWIDGERTNLSNTMTYKGLMFSDVPNLALAIGYTNASWTLKCDLTCQWVARLLNHMQQNGWASCTPRQRDPEVKVDPLIDFSSGYIQRSIDLFPKQGSKPPWRAYNNYLKDVWAVAYGSMSDPALEFGKSGAVTRQSLPHAPATAA
jgi:cation diffusion facilitator CzcD-associated flavoprotein CzcO